MKKERVGKWEENSNESLYENVKKLFGKGRRNGLKKCNERRQGETLKEIFFK